MSLQLEWVELPEDFYDKCDCCQDLDKKKDDLAIHMEHVIKVLYGKGEIDLIDLENSLDELSHYFGVKLIPGDLQIQRSK